MYIVLQPTQGTFFFFFCIVHYMCNVLNLIFVGILLLNMTWEVAKGFFRNLIV